MYKSIKGGFISAFLPISANPCKDGLFIKRSYHYNGLELLGIGLILISIIPTLLIILLTYKPNWVQTPAVLLTNGITYIIMGLVVYLIGKKT